MKSLYTLIALLGLMSMLVGCNKPAGDQTPAGTNAPVAPAAPSTNAPAAK